MRERVKSQSGQATTEYILLLIITVALILALMTQFFKPLQSFISSYLGDYTACLLQTGELPSLGDDDSKSALSDQGCNTQFAPASLENGRPPKGSANTNANNSDAKKKSSSEGSSGNGSGGTSASTGGGHYYGPGRVRGNRSGDSSGASKKVVEIALDNGGAGGFFHSNVAGSAAYRQQRSMSIPLSGLTEAEKKKLAKKPPPSTRIIASDGVGNPPKKLTVKKPEKKAEAPPEDEPFTIGNFMRMLFIIAIILAIVIFVGGQVLQMSKSYDK